MQAAVMLAFERHGWHCILRHTHSACRRLPDQASPPGTPCGLRLSATAFSLPSRCLPSPHLSRSVSSAHEQSARLLKPQVSAKAASRDWGPDAG